MSDTRVIVPLAGSPDPTAPIYPNWPIPAYTGFDHITVTSITMNTIETLLTTGELPFVLFASASNVTTVAVRDNGVGDVFPYTMLEHSWLLTFNDDSPITLDSTDELTNARGGTVNPYTGHQGGEYVVPIREAGTYKLTLTSRGSDGVGGFISNSTTATITVNESTYRHEWYDGLNGNDTNDGLDPWGFALSTASYTESTGALNQTNAFTSYNHTAATAGNPTDYYNWIYITSADIYAGGTWHRITAKNSNSEIVISPKLGADDTNVITSDGAKQTFIGAARKSQASGGVGDPDLDRHDTFVHLRGNQGVTSYTFTEPFTFALGQNSGPGDGWGDVHKHIGGYDSVSGSGVLVKGSASMTSTDDFLNSIISYQTASQGNIARFSGLHNLELDGDKLAYNGFAGTLQETIQDDEVIMFNDRIKVYDCLLANAEFEGGNNGAFQPMFWKTDVDNKRNTVTPLETGTHTGSSGATNLTDSSKSWATNEWSTETRTCLITQAGNICQGRIVSNTSDTLTLLGSGSDGGLQYPDGTAATIANADSYEIVYPKAHAMYCTVKTHANSRMAIVGGTWKTDSDRRVRDHYIYPSGKDHMLFAYNRFSDGLGSGPSFALNINSNLSPGETTNYCTVVENYSEDSNWFHDASGGDSNPDTQGVFNNMLVARNAAKTHLGWFIHSSGNQFVELDNIWFPDDIMDINQQFHIPNDSSIRDWVGGDWVLARNRIYAGSTRIGALEQCVKQTTNNVANEVVDNIVHQESTTASMIDCSFSFLTNRVYKDNNFYAPNDTDGIMFVDRDGSDETLSQFNTTVGETNTATDPGWTDPANGDFT